MDGHVYLIHFSRPIGNPDKARGQAQHYIGWAVDPRGRLTDHRRGEGAKITAAAAEAGCVLTLVRTWDGTRRDERRLKNRKNARAMCPVCRGEMTA